MRRASRPSAAEAYRPRGLGSIGVVAVGPQATLLAGYCAYGPSLRVVAGHPIKASCCATRSIRIRRHRGAGRARRHRAGARVGTCRRRHLNHVPGAAKADDALAVRDAPLPCVDAERVGRMTVEGDLEETVAVDLPQLALDTGGFGELRVLGDLDRGPETEARGRLALEVMGRLAAEGVDGQTAGVDDDRLGLGHVGRQVRDLDIPR